MLNDELERIYRGANDITEGKRAPLTTEAIFKAMRAAMATEREACATACDEIALRHQQTEGTYAAGKKAGAFECADALRSNT